MVEQVFEGDRATLDAHLRRTRFCVGVEEERWEVLQNDFPYLEVRVTGRGLYGATHQMEFQLECRGFPAVGPFVQHWDSATRQRPDPPSDAAPSVADALKSWNENGTGYGGIYRPWQRGAAKHNNWARLRPDLAWHSCRDLTFIMEQLYALVSEQAAWLDRRAAA